MPFVSIIIPCRNEEKFIGQCLDSIIKQDYPKEILEVLVVDGASQDKTRKIVESYKLKLLDNPQKFTPFGLNIGIKNAKGEVIIRMDAHANYEKDYISQCVKYLREYNADNVGGVIRTLPSQDTTEAKAIAAVLSSSLGAASLFRLGAKKPGEVDTVFGGCYKKEVFSKVGLFDERMIRSQDIEFNKRLKKAGGKIILVPDIVSVYYPQSTFKGFLKHNFSDGFWVTYPLKFGVRYFSLRHLAPLFLTLGTLGSLIFGLLSFFGRLIFVLIFGSYLLFICLTIFKISPKKRLKYFPYLMTAVFIRHFGYGSGSIIGLIKILIP